MAIIIESSLSGQRKQGNMSVSCFFLSPFHRYYSNCKTRFTCWWLGLSDWGSEMIGLVDVVGGGIRKMGGSWVPTASGCCCFSSPVSQNIVHARLKREGERDEASSWIEYQRGYLNLGRQITHPQNHHHHLRDQTFKSVCPFLFFCLFFCWGFDFGRLIH